jgi:DNA adenine methylase
MEYKKPICFFAYVGGKHLMSKVIVKLIPPHKIYVEPFAGSAKVFFAKEPSEIEVLNDADIKIANLFYCVAFHFQDFWERVKWLLHSREILRVLKKKMKKSPPSGLGDIDHAVATYYCFVSSFGGKVGGFAYSIRQPLGGRMITKKILLLNAIRKRLKHTIIKCKDFEEVIKTWDTNTTFFIATLPTTGLSIIMLFRLPNKTMKDF